MTYNKQLTTYNSIHATKSRWNFVVSRQLSVAGEHKTRTSPGFTLIETIIYIALFGLIMSGSLLAAYGLIGSASQGSDTTTVVDEGSFVTRKIAWALSGMSAVPAIGGSGCNQTLSVTKFGHVDNPIEFRRNSSGNIEMRQGGAGSYTPLTTLNVEATCLKFSLFSYSGVPTGVSASTTIDGVEFAVTRYSRI